MVWAIVNLNRKQGIRGEAPDGCDLDAFGLEAFGARAYII